MASRFWVAGGTGNWNSTTNWASSSGGVSGASFPLVTDDVFIDALSGTSQVITVNVASACLSLSFTGAITPTLAGTLALSVKGNLTFISAMTSSYSGIITMNATVTGNTLTTNGLPLVNSFVFDGVGGGWTLQDNLILASNKAVTLTNGSLDTNGKSITANGFSSNNSNVRTLTLGNSTITSIGATGWRLDTATNLTFNAGTSTIVCDALFGGGGLTYNNVTIAINTAISGNNTINTLTINAGKAARTTSGSTQTVSSIVAVGSAGSLVDIHAITLGIPCTYSRSSGIQIFDYCTITDCTFTGGATFIATGNCVNGGGNTGITFGYPHKVMGQIITRADGILPIKMNGV